MKKSFNFFRLLLCIALVTFTGCSKISNLPTDPIQNALLSGAKSPKIIEDSEIIPIIIKLDKYKDIYYENYYKLPSKLYFINFLLACIKNNEIEFVNIERANKFQEQIESIILSFTVSNQNNCEAVKKRLARIDIPKTLSQMDHAVILMLKILTLKMLDHDGDVYFEGIFTDWNSATSFFRTPDAALPIILIAAAVIGTILVLRAAWWAIDCILCNECFKGVEKKALESGTTLEEEIQNCFDSSACVDCF